MAKLRPPSSGVDWATSYASLLAVFIAGVMVCQIALAQPAPTAPAPVVPAPPAAVPAPPAAAPARPAPAVAPPEEKFDEDPVDDAQKKNQFKILVILLNGKFNPGEQPMFEEYYRNYALARWTLLKNITNLSDTPGKMGWRRELRGNLQRAKSGPVHDDLNALTLEYMNKVATTGRYHPTVRANAMLMIGELNSVEQLGTEAPTPLPAALEVLVAAATNQNLPDYVRVEAMVGIVRHASAPQGIADPEAQRSLTAAMLRLAAVDPPAGPAAVGREWILAYALETLGYLDSVGENNAVYKALVKAVADNKLSLRTRDIAVASLGRLKYGGAGGINPVEAAAALGQFVDNVCNEVLRQPKQTSQSIPRRMLRQPLAAVLIALTGTGEDTHRGIGSLAGEAQRPFLDQLQKSIEKVTEFLDDRRNEQNDFTPYVEELRTAVEALLKKKPA